MELSLYYVANAEDTVSENIVLCYTTDKDIAVQKAIAMPVVESAVEGNVVTLSWAAVDGAAQYSVACNGKELETVEATRYEFEGEYETKYTFVVVAMPKDQEANIPSEGAKVDVTTEAAPVVEPEDVTATITFDNKSKRTTLTTSQQVWEENGIVVTNDKASSSSNVADYVKPARFYKGSKITVDAPGNIVSIVFDCNSSSYATALKNSIKTGTVSVSSDKVTVTLSEAVDNYVIESLTGGQVRMDSITVTYLDLE